LQEDLKMRRSIKSKYREAGISLVEIDRQANQVSITIHTSRPGIVIGRGGQRVDEMRLYLEKLTGKKVRLNIQETRQPELDAYLVARSIADQIERRIFFRRAIKQAASRTMMAGAKGVKVICSGRLGGAEIARREKALEGRVPLHTLRADIDYGLAEAHTTLGIIGVKVWIYKGDILPEPAEPEEFRHIETAPTAEVEEQVPVAEVVEQVPAAEVKEQVPAAEVEEQVPAAEVKEQVPAAEVKEQVPAAEVEEQVPAAEVEEQVPVAEVKEQVPAAEVVEQVPAAEVEEQVPAAEVEEQVPVAEVKEQVPAAEVVEQVPAAEVEEQVPAAEEATAVEVEQEVGDATTQAGEVSENT
jgi:small subunit ribosomal protein S3